MRHTLIGAIALLAISGCAVNGFEKYYMPDPGSEAVYSNPRFEHYNGEPKIYAYSNDPRSDNLRAEEDGYVQIGISSFYGPPATMTKADLIAQAAHVHAALVLVHSQYKDTVSGAIPWTVQNPPQISTVRSNGTVNSFGPGGYATGTYSGQSTITTPGGFTTYQIPYSVSRNDTVATFWVHQDMSKVSLGVLYGPLPDAVSTKLQRNTGIIVLSVVRGTPAFDANILRGDVILKIAGEDVINPQGFSQQLTDLSGQTVKLQLLRDDIQKTITVTLHHRS